MEELSACVISWQRMAEAPSTGGDGPSRPAKLSSCVSSSVETYSLSSSEVVEPGTRRFVATKSSIGPSLPASARQSGLLEHCFQHAQEVQARPAAAQAQTTSPLEALKAFEQVLPLPHRQQRESSERRGFRVGGSPFPRRNRLGVGAFRTASTVEVGITNR